MLLGFKHAANFNLINYQLINLCRQNGRAGGDIYIFIHKSIDVKEKKYWSIFKNDSEILSIEITIIEISFLVPFIAHPILVWKNTETL